MNNKKMLIILSLIIVVLIIIGVAFFESDTKNVEASSSNIEQKILKKNTETDIKDKTDKKNIYLFWGDGCSHCEELSVYLNEIKSKLDKHYNLYTFEVWYNKENKALMETFATTMNEEVKGVPYLIIGSKTFSGYAADMQKEILNAIQTEYKKTDYFDAYQNLNIDKE